MLYSPYVQVSLSHLSPGVGLSSTAQSLLSRPMQRKLVTLVHCQLVEEEGRVRAMRAARSLGERTVTELILQHQNPQQLSSNLWAAVRARGCQFLGPGRQFSITPQNDASTLHFLEYVVSVSSVSACLWQSIFTHTFFNVFLLQPCRKKL